MRRPPIPGFMRRMTILIAGGGIGCEVFEQVREACEAGVGINTLPHSIREPEALGLRPELDRAGIRTRQ